MSANVVTIDGKFRVISGGRDEKSVAASFAANDGGGGGGPDDPMLTARVEALERGIETIRVSLERIEKSQTDFAREMTELRRDLKERAVPAIMAQLSAVEAGLAGKPSTMDMQKISSDLNRMIWTVFGFILALLGAVVTAPWGLKKIGII